MPVTAECPSCGKSYQAPDAMVGRSVRCKQCQTVFRIEAPVPSAGGPDDVDIEGSNVDFDALSQSFGDETAQGTAMGSSISPRIDPDGRVSIRRRGDVEDLSVRGEALGTGRRANLRYRYPFARQVDIGLPWLLVALAFVVPLRLSLTVGQYGEDVTGGVGTSRFIFLFLGTALLVFPLLHVAINRAAEDLRFSLPRTPVWRSFACACSVLVIGGSLFILSGGTLAGAIVGLIAGVGSCAALVTLIFRLQPHEVGKTIAYAAIGAGAGTVATALLIYGINFIGFRVAAGQTEPTLFASPFGVGLPWIAKPEPVANATPTHPKKPPTATSTVPTPEHAVVVVPPPPPKPGTPLALAIPADDANGPKLIRSVELPAVDAGFAELRRPLVDSKSIGVVRDTPTGGKVECWLADDWSLPAERIGTNFQRSQGTLAVNTDGTRVVRIVSVPSWRIDPIQLGDRPLPPALRLGEPNGGRAIEGFLDDHDLVVRQTKFDGKSGFGFEVYDLSKRDTTALPAAPAQPLTVGPASDQTKQLPFRLGTNEKTVRWVPDGSGVLVAGSVSEGKWSLAVFPRDQWNLAESSLRSLDWSSGRLDPLGLAASRGGQAAILLETGGEAYLSVFAMRDAPADGVLAAPGGAIVNGLRLGLLQPPLQQRTWKSESDALCWVDDRTLLAFGHRLIDAATGATIGDVRLEGIANALRLDDDRVLLVQNVNGVDTLVVLTLDPAAVDRARAKAK